MSYQTKGQALGYILKSLCKSKIDLVTVSDVYLEFQNVVKGYEIPLDNYSTKRILDEIISGRFHEKDYKRVISELYYQYDMTTVEEGEQFLKDIEPLIKRYFI